MNLKHQRSQKVAQKSKHSNGYILHRLVVGQIEANCYIFGSNKTMEVAIIDPGADDKKIKELLSKHHLVPKMVINTHGHIDHISSNDAFGLPVHIHKDDAEFLFNPTLNLSAFSGDPAVFLKATNILNNNDIINIGDIELKVLHTPGHTPGGICLHYNGIIFTGDTLFANGVGRTDFPYGDDQKLITSIKKKLMDLDDDVVVLPGHGESTTIGAERNS